MSLDGLWAVFGSETTTGQQLRSLFGRSSAENSFKRISYPKLKYKSAEAQPAPPPLTRRTVNYPKFSKPRETDTIRSRPSRRPANAICIPSRDTPVLSKKDLSDEKRKLQDAFQFGSTKISEKHHMTSPLSTAADVKLPSVIGSWNTTKKD